MIKVFVDATGWCALVDPKHQHHDVAKDYYQQLLDTGTKLYTNINEITQAITKIKSACGLSISTEFSKIIEQSSLTSNLNVSWVNRRVYRAAIRQFFSIKQKEIEIRHCFIFEEVRKKKINIIFSFDHSLTYFGIPLMPQI
jgi:predicted nucleic acid-binding protein